MPEASAVEDLGRESYVNLATFRRDGRSVNTPVWVALLGGRLYVVTDGTSAKVKRIRATGRARVAACDVRGGVRGPWYEGTVRVVDDPGTIERAHAALRDKYGWQMWLLDTGSRLFGRYGRRAWLEVAIA